MSPQNQTTEGPTAVAPLHKILHKLREDQEQVHNTYLFYSNHRHINEFSFDDIEEMPDFSLQLANEFCNKAAPVYILKGRNYRVTKWLEISLLHYIYRMWFRPYQSEIEYGQFLVKIVSPTMDPKIDTTSLSEVADLAAELNEAFCDKVERCQNLAQELAEHDFDKQWEKLGPTNRRDDGYDQDMRQSILDQEFFILQPLFRAVAIAVTDTNFNPELPISQLPVVITCTGIEDGLSAPITFDPIVKKIEELDEGDVRAVKTTLETAIAFLMYLERRETEAFGLRPDPVTSTKDLASGCILDRDEIIGRARRLGWSEDMGSLVGPSSRWVDQEIYPSELGMTKRLMANMSCFEQIEKRGMVRCWNERSMKGA
ncbi:hypothetical protein BU24DRAFT_477357 [Aaosphaeria arxii CBS 175.79]|uniref:Uncharacterized protein n=1 Tax=Aaosphaeria arxii CBS 175.79 TaxID=1450172 RepID=A0A6A5Y4L9_9PLEO|nr:uncharacterized protein BU24DRAFT_477357 [Aaosphaeria arxii CBS 175.79]KAF2020209.1 hypothetical protein BU24DRAFT_477357 [Aaosphaeria arxii CBS 175.79]